MTDLLTDLPTTFRRQLPTFRPVRSRSEGKTGKTKETTVLTDLPTCLLTENENPPYGSPSGNLPPARDAREAGYAHASPSRQAEATA